MCVAAVLAGTLCLGAARAFAAQSEKKSSPRIINIVNFIRQTDYRLENSDSLMFDAVKRQIALSNKYHFPTTFLFQYDALINPEYQKLMKTSLGKDSELGAWWEITQPHVEAAGLKWRGDHQWVSTAHIAFTPGYTQAEREKLVDVYMEKFKEIYGQYPKSVGSWFIDSYTLQYMYEKYGIVASCNCKDQVGTDGYTLWGGYWNQAYYPSRNNAYMPAQTAKEQIPVPVFRMLGSDPMYQYDNGAGTACQGVVTLEPVYNEGGKNRQWVDYFLQTIVDEPCLAFNYAQAGQENSFTWNAMGEGLEMQFPVYQSLRDAGKIRIETLGESGKWFRDNFKYTPSTAITTMYDVRNEGNKSVWYNCRNYRANLYWEKDGFCFRDIHLFDENYKSEYFEKPGTGGQFVYYTLPLVDRFHWSTPENKTGLRFVNCGSDGHSRMIAIADPVVTEPSDNVLKTVSKDRDGNNYTITFFEKRIEVTSDNKDNWALELSVPAERISILPFKRFDKKSMNAVFRGYEYDIACSKGHVEAGDGTGFVYRLVPSGGKIVIDCKVKGHYPES